MEGEYTKPTISVNRIFSVNMFQHMILFLLRHAWEVMWEGPLGTVAVVGIATKEATLQVLILAINNQRHKVEGICFPSLPFTLVDTWIHSFVRI